MRGGDFYIASMTIFQPVYQVTDHTKHDSVRYQKHVAFCPMLSLTMFFYVFCIFTVRIAVVAQVI